MLVELGKVKFTSFCHVLKLSRIGPYMDQFVRVLQASQCFLEIVLPRTTKTRHKRRRDENDIGACLQDMLINLDPPTSLPIDREIEDAADLWNGPGRGPALSSEESEESDAGPQTPTDRDRSPEDPNDPDYVPDHPTNKVSLILNQ